ncbi:MAG: putative holin-like toxin [Clostridiales bacterium]|nr:putative holin-like toxin [Clostridiales bacterium]
MAVFEALTLTIAFAMFVVALLGYIYPRTKTFSITAPVFLPPGGAGKP